MLRLFLFFPILLLSQDIFVLPDEAEHYLHTYNNDLLRAKKEVYIFSPNINEYKLIHTIKKLSKKKVHITIISQENHNKDNKISTLSLLKNISIYTLSTDEKRRLRGTLTCVDDTIVYLCSESLEYSSLRNNYAFVLRKKMPCKHLFTDLVEKSIQKQ